MEAPPQGESAKPIVLTRWSIEIHRWLGSDTLRGLSLAAEGLFVRLALDQWEHGAAKPEFAKWKRAHGGRTDDFRAVWDEIVCPGLFEETPLGLVHPGVALDRIRCIDEIRAKIRGAKDAIGTRARDALGRLVSSSSPGHLDGASSSPPGHVQDRSSSVHAPTPPPTPTPPPVRDTPPTPLSAGVGSEPAPPVEKPAKKRAASKRIDPTTYSIPPALDSPEFRSALVDYQRTRKGGAWSVELADVRFRQMLTWGRERSIAALEHSSGYAGLVEPNGSRNGHSTQHTLGEQPDNPFLRELKRSQARESMNGHNGHNGDH